MSSPRAGGARSRIAKALASRAWLVGIVLLGVALGVRSIGDGFTLDDQVQRAMAQGSTPLLPGPSLDLFRTATGNTAQVHALVDVGAFPWFTYPQLRVAFWRPLTSLTHAADYAWWPNHPGFMHLQNLIWYGLLTLVAGLAYRRLSAPGWAAGLGLWLYAVDELHAEAVGWIACRNALIASVLGALTLFAHHAWRSAGHRSRWGVAGPLLLVAALLSGEIALGALAYVVAYELRLVRLPLRSRARALAPYLAVAVAWAVAYRALGYGVVGSGYYVEPLSAPKAYALAVAHNAPVLVAMQFGLPPATASWLGASLELAAPSLGLAAVLAFLVLVFAPVVARDRTAQFWALGMGLSLLPVCATLPHGRLMMLASLGAAGLVSRLFVVLVESKETSLRARAVRGVGWASAAALLLVHGLLAPLEFGAMAERKGAEARAEHAAIASAPLRGNLAGRTLVVVRAPHAFEGAVWLLSGRGAPDRVRMMFPGSGAVVVQRPDARTLVLTMASGLMSESVSWLFRGLQHGFAPGDRVVLSGLEVEVLAVGGDGRPTRVSFRFDRDLEDAAFAWLSWSSDGWEAFPLPVVGGQAWVK